MSGYRHETGPRPTIVEIPIEVKQALELRSRAILPSNELIDKTVRIPFFNSSSGGRRDFSSLRPERVGGDGSSSRFARSHREEKDGWTTMHRSSPMTTPVRSVEVSSTNSSASVRSVEVSSTNSSVAVREKIEPVAPPPRPMGGSYFKRMGVEVDKSFEEKHMSRILGKLNKIADDNYETTKDFLKEFLDPDPANKLLLTNFVNAVFDMAASSAVLCKICTKLLHDLGDEFPHVRVEMRRLFDNFMLIFDDTIGEPDTTSSNYGLFLEAQKRKRMRRGYSRFIAELIDLKELPVPSYLVLLELLTNSLKTYSVSEENKLQCTEYADCLKLLFQSSVTPSGEWLKILVAFATTEISKLPPGLSSQSKFALMDIVEALKLI